MGFGDKTVREVCEEQGVDTYTFMTVVNFAINGWLDNEAFGRLSVATLYDIYISERMLYQHVEIEERIFMPAIRLVEYQIINIKY